MQAAVDPDDGLPFCGERSRLLETSLVELPDAQRVETGDGPLWIVEREAA